MTVGELRRTPTVDRAPDELLGADEEPEADKDDDRVLPTQTIDVVIVHTKFQFADAQHRLEQAIHLADRCTTVRRTTIIGQTIDLQMT